VSKDQDYCGETLPNETYLLHDTGGVKNAVIFIEAAPPAGAGNSEKLNLIENDGCRYAPRITAMQKGDRVRIKNNDPKLHIPHSYLNQTTVFMLSLPFKNSILDATHRIRQPGILKLVCDTHAWMLGFIHVFEHPYFAVTDDQGTFTIPNVPPGTYVLKAWHEVAGTITREITGSDMEDNRIDFEIVNVVK
jgi:hypothetical protein